MARRNRLAWQTWPGVLICLLLTACGDLPEPFLGNPGATARRLAQPLTASLAVPPGTDTLLPDAANQELAKQVALALQASEVPATARQPQKTDWRVITSVKQQGNQVTPVFKVQDPDGKEQGAAVGEPVPIQTWARPDQALLEQVASDAGTRIGAVLTSIRITRDKADPNSLYNRPARVLLSDVTGAPGDGNVALTRQMRTKLAALGPVVLTTPSGADYAVQGDVKIVPIAKGQERVEIVWTITSDAGMELGKVVQLNEIPAGTLNGYWGDVASVVAAEASAGVNEILRRQAGHEPNDLARPSRSAQAEATQPGSAQAAVASAGPQQSITAQAPAASGAARPVQPAGASLQGSKPPAR